MNLEKLMAKETLSLLESHAWKILKFVISRLSPEMAIERNITIEGNSLYIKNTSFNLKEFKNIYVVGFGKGSLSMAKKLETLLKDKITAGIVISPEVDPGLERIKSMKGGHPIPNKTSLIGATEIYELCKSATQQDFIIFLISGGGSALLSLPVDAITLEDKIEITNLLLKSGADINEINCVRKHISKVKGGQLCKIGYPAKMVSLIISDVVGDNLTSIASGPTVPDNSSFSDAINVLKKYALWSKAPDSVKEYLLKGQKTPKLETPKKGEIFFKNIINTIISNNLDALMLTKRKATELGYNSLILSDSIEGESFEVGKALSGIAISIACNNLPVKKPACLISGGETTVTVRGEGKGGPNQEFVVGTIESIANKNIVCVAIDTDGIDGPTDASGGIVNGCTAKRLKDLNLEISTFRSNNNCYYLLSKVQGLIKLGRTGTNVNDLRFFLVN
jgi:glycerate-2-kinase